MRCTLSLVNNIRQNAPTVIVQKLFGRCPKENPQLRNCLGCSSGRCPMTNGPLPQQNAEDFALDYAYPLPFPLPHLLLLIPPQFTR